MSTINPPAPHGHGHEEPALGSANADSVLAGHEPDNEFAVKPIMAIPIAVVATFVIAFSVAAGAFAYFNAPPPNDPFAQPEAVKRNAEGINEQLSRTMREGLFKNKPNVDQPRLEPLRRLEGDGMFYARPPLPTGNSPEIHVDAIKPDRVAALHTAGYADHDKKFAHIPIGEAMKAAVKEKMFPVQKNGSKATPTADKPSESSGGFGVQPPAPK
jgi:hypothetical protein